VPFVSHPFYSHITAIHHYITGDVFGIAKQRRPGVVLSSAKDLVLVVLNEVRPAIKSQGVKLKKFEKMFEKKSGRIWSRRNKSTLTGKYGS